MIKYILIISIFLTALTCCKKDKIECSDKVFETDLKVKIYSSNQIALESTGDIVKYEFLSVDESRCSNWYWNHDDKCNYLFGSAYLYGNITINNDTTFLYKPRIGGCMTESNSPKIDMYYKKIKILLNKVNPYPKNYNDISFDDYEVTFKIFQTVTICE